MSAAAAGGAAVEDDREAEALYQRIVLERARTPRNGALLECFDAEADGINPMCGDRLTLRLAHAADGTIGRVGFEARGCAISLASADLMAEAVRGLDHGAARALAASFAAMVSTGTVPEALAAGELRALAGVHAHRARIRCATLAWNALERALDDRKDGNV